MARVRLTVVVVLLCVSLVSAAVYLAYGAHDTPARRISLARMGETPESFFRRHIFTCSHDNSIQSVAEKFVDGAAVDSLIWEYLNAKGQRWPAQTRIIDRSEPFGIPPMVVSPDIEGELKEKFRSAFLNMHDDPRGREILDRVLIDRFTEIEDNAYDSIREMEILIRDARLDK